MSSAKNVGKNTCKNISKNLIGKYSQKCLDYAKQSVTDAFKTTSKRAIQKHQKQLVIWLVTKLLIKLQKIWKIIVQKQLRMNMIKKGRYSQKKNQKIIDNLRLTQ